MTALFFSFIVSTLPDSPEEQRLVEFLDFLGSRMGPAKANPVAAPHHHRRIYMLTNLLHEQRQVWLTDDGLTDYDSTRISNCAEEKTSKKSADVTTQNDTQSRQEQKSERKCYWIDSYFPRNLILNERVLVANKGLEPEILAALQATTGETKTEHIAKAEGLHLQGRHLEYADFSRSSLPNVDLRRAHLNKSDFFSAKLEKAKLVRTELSGANLGFTELAGADLQGATLSGADLTGIYISAMTQKQAKTETGKLGIALQSLSKYQGTAGQTDLKLKLGQFRQAIITLANFTAIAANPGCLTDTLTTKKLKLCRDIADPAARSDVYKLWLQLACNDSTEQHWIAQRFIERAETIDSFFLILFSMILALF